MSLILYALTAFLSAFLLFWSQPLMAKALLPLLGGAPAVWNTALMFFQITLLAGYVYAHLIARFARRTQAAIHTAVLAAALGMLPFGNTAGIAPPHGVAPILWLVATLGTTVGVPFFAVSASAPLLQSWFKGTGHRHAGDPYLLYAASNLGSLAALLGFPVVLERTMSVPGQGTAWMGLFLVLALLIGACLWAARGLTRQAATGLIGQGAWRERAIWVLLAFVPSSLLLGVTSYVATDLASVPLLWVVPLALYLVTFILAFGRLLPPLAWVRVAMVGALAVVCALLVQGLLLSGGHTASATFGAPLHFLCFFLIALGCHAALAARLPPVARLTEFYLFMSAGGALGGIFNALIAPLIFAWTYEYELALVLAGLASGLLGPGLAFRPIQIVAPMLLLAAVKVSPAVLKTATESASGTRAAIFAAVIGLALAWLGRLPWIFGASIAGVLGGAAMVSQSGVLHVDRSFFGVHKVVNLDGKTYTALVHGSTIHGVEATDPAHWRDILGYYSENGPIGQILHAMPAPHRVGVIGLGTGAMACYAKPGQDWVFYEIDPSVVRLAYDSRYFHFLSSCAPTMRMVIGDGRLSLQAEPAGSFDLLVLDAFSSDSIPTHLLTREALLLYINKLAPHGLIAFHVSNRYLDLAPTLAATAQAAGLSGLNENYVASPKLIAQYRLSAQWIVMARGAADLGFLTPKQGWQKLPAQGNPRAWTDAFSNILDALR